MFSCFLFLSFLATPDPEYSYVLDWRPFTPTPVPVSRMEMDCTKLLELNLEDAVRGEVLYRRGVLKSWLKDQAGASRDLRAAAQTLPRRSEINYEVGRCLIRENKLDDSEAMANQLIVDSPSTCFGDLLLAEVEVERSSFVTALRSLSSAVKRDPSEVRVHLMRAHCHHRIGMWQECLEDVKEVLASGPFAPESAYTNLHGYSALAFSMTGHHDQAIASAIKCRDLDPSQSNAWSNLWFCCVNARKGGIALNTARGQVQQFPSDSNGYARLAISEASIGRFDVAEKMVREAIRLDKREINSLARNALGRIHWIRGDWEGASEGFKEAVRLSSNDFDARLRLGLLWSTCPVEALRHRDKAAQVFRSILTQKRWNIYDARVGIVLACIAADHGDFDEALAQLKRVNDDARTDESINVSLTRLRKVFEAKVPYRMPEKASDRVFDLPILSYMIDESRTPHEARE